MSDKDLQGLDLASKLTKPMQTGSTKSTQETQLYTAYDEPLPHLFAEDRPDAGLDFFAGIRKLADGHQLHLGVTARNVEWARAADRTLRWVAVAAGAALGFSTLAFAIAALLWCYR